MINQKEALIHLNALVQSMLALHQVETPGQLSSYAQGYLTKCVEALPHTALEEVVFDATRTCFSVKMIDCCQRCKERTSLQRFDTVGGTTFFLCSACIKTDRRYVLLKDWKRQHPDLPRPTVSNTGETRTVSISSDDVTLTFSFENEEDLLTFLSAYGLAFDVEGDSH